MCSLHLTHPSVHTWSSGQPTVQRPGSSRGLPVGAGIRTHNLGLPRVLSPTLYPLGQRLPMASGRRPLLLREHSSYPGGRGVGFYDEGQFGIRMDKEQCAGESLLEGVKCFGGNGVPGQGLGLAFEQVGEGTGDGAVVGNEPAVEMGMVEGKVEAISSWPLPTTIKELQWFLGFSHFYRRFIANYSTITSPLTDLLKGKAKSLSLTPPRLHPCAFFSRKLSPAEKNYDIGNRELLAIKLALEEWRHWLEGAAQPFLVLTDHKNLHYLRNAKRLNPRQARWALFFTRFQFKISYRPGPRNIKADALSRIHAPEESKEEPEGIILLKSSPAQFSGLLHQSPPPILLPTCWAVHQTISTFQGLSARPSFTPLILHLVLATQGSTPLSRCYETASGGPTWPGM